MFDILMVVVVGRAFYALAAKHQKSPWPYAVLGAASGYIGIVVGGLLIGIGAELLLPGFVESASGFVLGLIAIPFGLLTCWLLYMYLKRSWSKPKEISKITLDSDLIGTHNNSNRDSTPPRSEENRYNQSER